MSGLNDIFRNDLSHISPLVRNTANVVFFNKGNLMPNNSHTLTHCPACGEELEALPVHGDCRHFICPKHRQFGISGTAIAMMNGNEHHRTVIGKRIEEARNSEQELIITSDDINAPKP